MLCPSDSLSLRALAVRPCVTPNGLMRLRSLHKDIMTEEDRPTPPASLPKYLANGLPKQDSETLSEAQEYIEALIEWSQRPVDEEDLPADAQPVEDSSDEQGTVVEEMVTCGDETCACMSDGEKHGPYLYRYYREGGKLTSEYLGKP